MKMTGLICLSSILLPFALSTVSSSSESPLQTEINYDEDTLKSNYGETIFSAIVRSASFPNYEYVHICKATKLFVLTVLTRSCFDMVTDTKRTPFQPMCIKNVSEKLEWAV